LVEHNVDINGKSSFGYTPLVLLCGFGNETLVKYLVEHGADVNEAGIIYCCYYYFDNRILTPLMVACSIGNLNIVKYLVEHGADINKNVDNKYTALK